MNSKLVPFLALASLLAMTLLLSACRSRSESEFQDPVKVDSKHYKVEFEDQRVRVIHARYGPHEKSPMHDHPDHIVIALTTSNVREIGEDGKPTEGKGTPGTGFGKSMRHSLENLDDTPFESYIIEFKKP